ncbi:MAG: hypothetical protein R3C32_02590 [Chloroflexota bacterium]
MTLDPAQARELVDAARTHARHLLVPYGWHCKPFVREAKRLMEAGMVGGGSGVRALPHGIARKGFFAGGGGPPETWVPTIADRSGTWQLPERGGGYAHGQVTHSGAHCCSG